MCSQEKIVRAFLLAGMLFVAFFVVADLTPVDAAFMSCRADPLVFLSNGDTVRIIATMDTSAANVASINYTLRVPQGVSVNRVVYTGGPFAKKESLKVIHDTITDYVTEAVVTTYRPGVRVNATSSLRQIQSSSNGYDRQILTMALPR